MNRAKRSGPLEVPFFVHFQLALQEVGIRRVTDGQKHADGGQLPRRIIRGRLQSNSGHPVFVVPQHLGNGMIPNQLDLTAGERSFLHDLRGAQLIASNYHVHSFRILGQVGRFFHRRIAAPDDHQRCVAEPRQRPIANGTGANAAILVGLFGGESEVIRSSSGRDNHRVRFHPIAAGGFDFERQGRKIHFDDVVTDNPSAEIQGLLLHQLHQLNALDGVMGTPVSFVAFRSGGKIPVAVFVDGALDKRANVAGRKARVVFDFGRVGQAGPVGSCRA